MREMYIIGTIHMGFTPHAELAMLLEETAPDQVFVELSDKPYTELQSDVQSGEDSRDEMLFAYEWARERNIPVACFDAGFDEFREGMSGKRPEYQELVVFQQEQLTKFSWRDLNRPEYRNALHHEHEELLFDPEKKKSREQDMLKNIMQEIVPAGRVAIVTGTAHVPFFEEKFPEAYFPARERNEAEE